MFVSVSAARVRDLFMKPAVRIILHQTAALIEAAPPALWAAATTKEQTLNHLAETGFDPAPGVILLAATNPRRSWTLPCCGPAASTARCWTAGPADACRSAGACAPRRLAPGPISTRSPASPQRDRRRLITCSTRPRGVPRAARNSRAAGPDRGRRRVLTGVGSAAVLNPAAARVALHGHALVAAALPGVDPVLKVSIIRAAWARSASYSGRPGSLPAGPQRPRTGSPC